MQQMLTDLETYLGKCLDEFKTLEAVLARAAEINSLLSAVGKVVLIFLGAFVTTREVANQLLGANSGFTLVIFTFAGVLIAVIAGLEAAFKWEKSAVELKSLAGSCQKEIRDGTYQLHKAHLLEIDGEKCVAIEKIIDLVNEHLDDIYTKSATLGINVVREVKLKQSQTT